jgi:hypothetical protein
MARPLQGSTPFLLLVLPLLPVSLLVLQQVFSLLAS